MWGKCFFKSKNRRLCKLFKFIQKHIADSKQCILVQLLTNGWALIEKDRRIRHKKGAFERECFEKALTCNFNCQSNNKLHEQQNGILWQILQKINSWYSVRNTS